MDVLSVSKSKRPGKKATYKIVGRSVLTRPLSGCVEREQIKKTR